MGGSHRNVEVAAENLKQAILSAFDELRSVEKKELIDRRRKKFSAIGEFSED